MNPGVRVVRGKDWKWRRQDGGEGNAGTVIDVDRCPPGCVVVKWDAGCTNTYRNGYEDAFDLRIVETTTNGEQIEDYPSKKKEKPEKTGETQSQKYSSS